MKYDYQKVTPGLYDFGNDKRSIRGLWHHKKFKTLSDLVSDVNPKLLIDLGCGPGVFIRDYCKTIPLAIGFDISINQIEYASQFNNKNRYFVSNLDALFATLKTWSSDLAGADVSISSIELLEHVEKEESLKLIRDLRNELNSYHVRSLNMFISTPNKRSFWPIVEKLIDLFLGTDYRIQHMNIMNSSKFREILIELQPKEITVQSYMSFRHWLFNKKGIRPYSIVLSRGMLLLSKLTL